ncbi:MAG: LPS export ABC transporter periplasmic protein LptC [Porticoccaceae bacterium]
MNERRLLLFLTFLPIALAVFIWDLDVDFTSGPPPQPEQLSSDLPITILEQVQLTQFDQRGLQSQRVSSQRLTSFDVNELVQISQPTLELRTDDSFWTATSQNGVFFQNENRLTLNGDVTLQKQDPNTPVTMLTSQLDYYPDMRLAETDTPVSIQATGHDIRSDGISVDLANSIYVLTNQVRSRHEPL